MPGGAEQLTLLRALICFLLVCLAPLASADPALRMTSNVTWTADTDWFGGFSGAEMSPDGGTLKIITDRGSLITARIFRTDDEITAIGLQSRIPLAFANGRPLPGTIGGDAEGLAISTGGDTYISFEQRHRVTRLDRATGRTHRLPDIPGQSDFPKNSGLEALAVHPDGTLLALPERPRAQQRDAFPLLALRSDEWETLGLIPRRGPFLPVGADVDSQGRLYLLERTVSPLGFRSRIRRFDLNEKGWPEATLLVTTVGQYHNLEGLSVWQDKAGKTRLTAVSDNNFLSVLKTQIVEFTLKE